MRGALACVLSLAITSCAHVAPDPIVGCWQREDDGYALILTADGAGEFELSEEAAAAPVSYAFPHVRWRRSGDTYHLRYSRTQLQRAYAATARVEGAQLVIEGATRPFLRADADSWVAWR